MEPARKPCPLHFAKVVFQALQHRFFIFRPVCPGEKGLAVWGLPGIGKVEYIFQPKLRACILQEGDAHGPRLDPAAVAASVPLLQRGAGGGVWALGIDENLFWEGVFVHPRGGSKERFPFCRAAHDPRHGLPGQCGYGVCFPGHLGLLLFISSRNIHTPFPGRRNDLLSISAPFPVGALFHWERAISPGRHIAADALPDNPSQTYCLPAWQLPAPWLRPAADLHFRRLHDYTFCSPVGSSRRDNSL